MQPRRSFLLVGLGAAVVAGLNTGCSGRLPETKARSAAVVTIGDAVLDGKTLEGWLTRSPRLPDDRATSLLVSVWIDNALYLSALRDNLPLTDSAITTQVIFPDAARGALGHFWGQRTANMPRIPQKMIDSLDETGHVRVFQHLFLTLPAKADSATRAQVVAKARDLQRRARAGTSFSQLVREASQDTATLRNNGFLPGLTKDDLPEALQTTAWDLKPGEISAIIGSSNGLHLLRRATSKESGPGLEGWLAPRLAAKADTQYMDSLSRAKSLKLSGDVAARLRAMAFEPLTAPDGPPLATWTGGSLTPAEARIWIGMVPPIARLALRQGSDSAMSAFGRDLAHREMILQIAAPDGAVSPEAWKALTPVYRAVLDTLKGIAGAVSGKTPGEGATTMTDAVVGGKLRYQPLPGGLAGVLRARYQVKVDQQAIESILSLARTEWREKHADSSSTGPAVVRSDSGPPIGQ